MTLDKLFARYRVDFGAVPPETDIAKIVTDSRAVAPGDLFICLRGTKTDGHAYIADALRTGAAAVVAEASSPEAQSAIAGGARIITAPDTRAAAAYAHSAYWGDPADGINVVGVTGTNGKTTVTYMLRSILRSAGYRVGLIGGVRVLAPSEAPKNSDRGDYYDAGHTEDDTVDLGGGSELASQAGAAAAMTTPDPAALYSALAEMKSRRADFVVMEASSHALELHKLDPIRFRAGIFTNLSPEHLDFHITMENYFAAKARLFSLTDTGIINCGDAYARQLQALSPGCAFTRCAVSGADADGDCDCRAEDIINLGVNGVEYTFVSRSAAFKLRCPIPGGYTVANSLLAAACALRLGVDPTVIQDSLRSMRGVDGRLERVRLGVRDADYAVFIDYAHTPAALENMLGAMRMAARESGGRLVVVFGCGGDRDPLKRPAMGEIATRLADFTIVTSDNSRTEDPAAIIEDILEGADPSKPLAVIQNRRDAIRRAIFDAQPGDVIVLAGKGHEKYEIDARGKHAFDEAAIAREAAAERAGNY